MRPLRAPSPIATPAQALPVGAAPWLLLTVQLPAHPSNARVKTWRRLQQIGAVALKGSVYVLPNSAQAVEDFEWLRTEVRSLKGHASVFTAASLDGLEDDSITEQFRQTRDRDYKALIRDLKAAQARARRASVRDQEPARVLRQLEERLTQIRRIDFFSASAGATAQREFVALEDLVVPPATDTEQVDEDTAIDAAGYQARLWITRPRPGVDRMASAWLISRFIDRAARFDFTDDAARIPAGVPFDMYGTGFGHAGTLCTFEVLQMRFRIKDVAVRRLGEIVHDLDLKEERYRPPQAAGVAAMVDGLQSAFDNDHELLANGIVLFDAVYRGLQMQQPTRSRARHLRHPKSGGSE